MRILKLLCVLGLCGASLNAVAAPDGDRVIVKFRDTASGLKQARAADRTRQLGERIGVTLEGSGEPGPGMQVMRARGLSAEVLARRLARQADIEYAVPDGLRHARALPNDGLFADQWHLQDAQPAAIRATTAWDVTTGSNAIVTAVIDTGILSTHPDLAGRLLPGYDFISDAALAGDGNGRDSNPADPGDFISNADIADPALQAVCPAAALVRQESSWHGTRVAGVLAAATNNSLGVAGTTWRGGLLPVRALGKCGGFDSDIIAAMRWAAGLAVPGVLSNANPARIINLSLGGSGTCSAAYRDTIAELASIGVLVVAAAGNETGPVETPANCPGVLAVAGLRHIGTKVGYSSMGAEVAIAAPAGNCVSDTLPCQFPITTLTNSGTTSPTVNTYTDGFDYNVGTSFSAPLAAGSAALMLALNPALTPDKIIARMQSGARSFPVDGSLPTCPATASSGQCNCTTSTCGAGMLDAAAALAAASGPVAGIEVLDPLKTGTIRLDGSSAATAGRVITGWQWALVSAPTGASLGSLTGATNTLQAPGAGSYRLRLTVTDNLGASDTSETTLTVSKPSGGGGGGSADWLFMLGVGLLGAAAYRRRSHHTTSAQAMPPDQP